AGLHPKNRHDPVTAVDDDDLVSDHEVEEAAPLRTDVDEHDRHLDHVHAGRDAGAHPDSEARIIDARNIAARQHRLPDLGALLRAQLNVAARLALLRLALRGLRFLTPLPLCVRRLGLLAVLSLLSLRGLRAGLLGLAGALARGLITLPLRALRLRLLLLLRLCLLLLLRLCLLLLGAATLHSLLALRRLP